MADREMEEKNVWQPSISSKHFQKQTYLICPNNPTFYRNNDVQVTQVYQSLKENLTNLTFLGKKKTLVTAASIIYKPFALNHARELTEEHFIQLVEDKSAYVSEGKRKIGRKQYASL